MGAIEAAIPFLELLKDTSCDSGVHHWLAQGLAQLNAPNTVMPLLKLLNNTNKDIRYRAASVLAQMGNPAAVTPLLELFKNTDEYGYYHFRATELLAQIGTSQAVSALIKLLKNTNRQVHCDAKHGLTKIGTKEVVTLLLKLLSDTDPKIRFRAVDVLAQMGAYEAVSPLIGLLKDTNQYVRRHAAHGLAQLGAVEAVTPLIDLLKDKDAEVRNHAAKRLAKLGAVEAIKPLIESLQDSERFVRSNAATELARIGALEAVKPLIGLLKDPDNYVQSCTTLELAQMNAPEAIIPLIELLKKPDKLDKDNDEDIRRYAMLGLAQMGAIEAIKPLIELHNKLNDIDSFAGDSAVEGLAQLGVTKAVKPLIKLLKSTWENVHMNITGKNVYWNLVVALNQLDPDNEEFSKKLAQEFEMLKEQSRHPSVSPRQQAAEKLGDFVSKESVSLLTPLLEDKNLIVKKQAIISLGQIGERQPALLCPLLSQLRRLTSDLSIHIRRDTITTLGKIVSQLPYGKKKWFTKFANLAKNQQELFIIRVVALKALAKLGTDEAAQLILKMLSPEKIQQEEYSFVLTAFRALGDIRSKVALEFLRQQLEALTERKQTWRKQRDTKPAAQLNAWHESQLETELGYAIAQIEPKKAGINMLYHDLAEVRKGAWLAIGSLGDVNIIKDLVEKHRESQVDEAHFRHAAFRAIDKSLITLEVKGNKLDLEKLKALLPDTTHAGIKDRVEWTIYQFSKKSDFFQKSDFWRF
jgi:HEAT repeat protein